MFFLSMVADEEFISDCFINLPEISVIINVNFWFKGFSNFNVQVLLNGLG